MRLLHALAAFGVGAVAVAGLAYGGTVLDVGPTRVVGQPLLAVADLALFLGTTALTGATLARSLGQLNRAIRLSRHPE